MNGGSLKWLLHKEMFSGKTLHSVFSEGCSNSSDVRNFLSRGDGGVADTIIF